MEANSAIRASSEHSASVPPANVNPASVPPRPPLHRTDSRTGFPAPGPRPVPASVPPPQQQQRPQFQPGGPVNNPPQYLPRPGTPAPRGPPPPLPQQAQAQRPPVSLQRPPGLQSPGFQKPQAPQAFPPRAPPPGNLQFGPRQPTQVGAPTTPEGARPLFSQQQNILRNGAPSLQPLIENKVNPTQYQQQYQGSARGPDIFDPQKNKSVTLDNPSIINENINKTENEASSIVKNRSYSIAAAPGAPSPLKLDDDRRKSVSAIGGKIEELGARAPGLGPIQEVKTELKDHGNRSSKENLRSEESREFSDRPNSRLANSKMAESFIGSQAPTTPKKKLDDDDDVILQNNKLGIKLNQDTPNTKQGEIICDRSPSLTRSEESPEPKPVSPMPINKTTPKQCITPEPQAIKPMNDAKIKEIKVNSKSPVPDEKSMTPVKKPSELYTDARKSTTPRKTASAPKSRPKDGDNDSGVDESTQGNDVNGSPESPNKRTPCKLPVKEKSTNGLPALSRSSSKSAATAKTPENPLPAEKKKVPMNKVQVGTTPSPNIKAVKSKIGSLDNSSYKPGGGKIKIENRKIDFQNVTPRIAAKNETYAPSGGTKKIASTKLEWNAKSKIGSLQNSTYKPGGGDKKIETVKLDFKEKAKPKVASTVNITHKPGGGAIKIENQKLDFKAQSKVGSLDNVKHKPGGGDVKIFDDKDYIKTLAGQSPAPPHSGQEEYYMSLEWEDEEERPISRCKTARTPRQMSPRRRRDVDDMRRVIRNNERNKRPASARPASARGPARSDCSRNSSSILNRPAFTVY